MIYLYKNQSPIYCSDRVFYVYPAALSLDYVEFKVLTAMTSGECSQDYKFQAIVNDKENYLNYEVKFNNPKVNKTYEGYLKHIDLNSKNNFVSVTFIVILPYANDIPYTNLN